jgi:Zn-finger nucleic acid-binding protein
MQEWKVQDMVVDVCEGGCGGLWFDWMELAKVDEPDEAVGDQLLEVRRDLTLEVDHQASRQCPRCPEQIMTRHFASVKREVSVDECPACGGFFLDHGELNTIRGQFASEEERSQAAQELFEHLFGDEMARRHAESEAAVESSRRLAHMFRFLLPSYYLKGKQPWGAF